MNPFFTRFLYGCIFILQALTAKTQTTFSSSVSPKQAAINEYITLTCTVANGKNVQSITPPALADFTVVSGPNTSSEQNTINGVSTQYISLSYVLQAKKKGCLKIGPATAIVNGKRFTSNQLKVTVGKSRNNTNSPSIPSLLSAFDPFNEPKAETQFDDFILKPGENIQEKVDKNMQLRLETNKKSCYVGEPLLASYKLYTRLKSESSLSKNPSFNGFSVVEMMQQNSPDTYTSEKLNGKMYHVYNIRQAQLYPLQPGNIELETASLDNKITFLKYSGNNGSYYNVDPDALINESVTLSSKPIMVTIKPLPEEGKPVAFTGAVGNFNMEVFLQKKQFAANETVSLFITITGSGNMQLLTLPQFVWPAFMETFDTKVKDNTDSKTVPISGSKTFEIPFLVTRAGNFSIPPISFCFFDLGSNSYKSVVNEPISFTVDKQNAVVKNPLSPAQNGITTSETNNLNKWLLILLAVFAVIIIYVFWMNKQKKDTAVYNSSKLATEENNTQTTSIAPIALDAKPLNKTEDCLFKNDCDSFYGILNEELKSFFAASFHVSKDTLNSKTLAGVMDKAGIDNDIILAAQNLLQEIEWQLYTPFERNEAIHDVYVRAQEIVQHLTSNKA